MAARNKIIFAGGGGHALSLLEAFPDAGDVLGYLAPSPAASMPVEYLGDDAMAAQYVNMGCLFHIAFIYAGKPIMEKRRQLIEYYERIGARFASIVAPSAIVTPNSKFGIGCAILNGAIVNRANIGDFCVVNSGAIVEHDCVIGKNTFIAPGAVIGGGTTIGDDCFIGLGARLRNGITIGNNITVGMGATIIRSLSKPGIYR